MKVALSLSSKVDANGRSEILLSAQSKWEGKVRRMRAKSGVFVRPEFFSKEKGVEMSRRRVIANDVREWHIAASKRLNGILSAVATAEMSAPRANMCGNWLRDVIEKHLHPDLGNGAGKSVCDLADEYVRRVEMSDGYRRHVLSTVRALCRYEGFVRETDKNRMGYVFAPNKVGLADIEGFMEYLGKEAELSKRYPELFARLLQDYPVAVSGKFVKPIQDRGNNARHCAIKRLRTMWKWLLETGRVKNDPFIGFRNVPEVYGTPYYITVHERDTIASAAMPTAHLEVQRDIFVFQCLVGCRVSDLMRLTWANVRDGILEYTPRKTKDEGEAPAVARVPLLPQALELMEKYRGKDARGRLFPCISSQKYNNAIKEVFTTAGITRDVEVRDSLTGEIVLRPINDVASSHIARRTFIGNLYQQVQDPNLIGKMSGHAEGSTAFARYRKIEDDTLRKVIETIK